MTAETIEKLKRLGVTVLTVALIALNKKLGLDLSVEELGTIALLVVGYVTSGTWKAAQLEKAKTAAETRAGEVDTLYDASQSLKNAVDGLRKVVEDGQVASDLNKE